VSPLFEESVLRLMSTARNLQLVACMALVAELPLLETGLAPIARSLAPLSFCRWLRLERSSH
jgi:hypothetical protein